MIFAVSFFLSLLFYFHIGLKCISYSQACLYLYAIWYYSEECDSGLVLFYFMQSHASQILGFKFQYFQRNEVNTPVPTGLYQLTALMVKKEFIDVDSM